MAHIKNHQWDRKTPQERKQAMKRVLLTVAAMVVSTAAFALDPIGPVNMTRVLNPPAPTAEKMAEHRAYVKTLNQPSTNARMIRTQRYSNARVIRTQRYSNIRVKHPTAREAIARNNRFSTATTTINTQRKQNRWNNQWNWNNQR